MITVCGVRFTPNGKIHMYLPGKADPEEGDFVVVESQHGLAVGEVVYTGKEVEKLPEGPDISSVVRIATDGDLNTAAENVELAKKAFAICKEMIEEQKLEMKLFRVEYALDRSKASFYYVSEQRVDFRNLVKDLAPRIKSRIEMVQVGPREHAKDIGGMGLCGRQFCCQGFMTTFEPVTIKMAKDQGLTSNPSKYSGSCGKLLCCIRHEEPAYEYAHGIMPKNGALVMTEDGPGKIIVVNMLKETCTVKVGLEQSFEIKSYKAENVRPLNDAERAEYLALRRKEHEEMSEPDNNGRRRAPKTERTPERTFVKAAEEQNETENAPQVTDRAGEETGEDGTGEKGDAGRRSRERGFNPRYRKGRKLKNGEGRRSGGNKGEQPKDPSQKAERPQKPRQNGYGGGKKVRSFKKK